MHARTDATVNRTATIRVTQESISDLGSFFEDAKRDKHEVQHLVIEKTEYLELSSHRPSLSGLSLSATRRAQSLALQSLALGSPSAGTSAGAQAPEALGCSCPAPA
jgi:hypothetical protein